MPCMLKCFSCIHCLSNCAFRLQQQHEQHHSLSLNLLTMLHLLRKPSREFQQVTRDQQCSTKRVEGFMAWIRSYRCCQADKDNIIQSILKLRKQKQPEENRFSWDRSTGKKRAVLKSGLRWVFSLGRKCQFVHKGSEVHLYSSIVNLQTKQFRDLLWDHFKRNWEVWIVGNAVDKNQMSEEFNTAKS